MEKRIFKIYMPLRCIYKPYKVGIHETKEQRPSKLFLIEIAVTMCFTTRPGYILEPKLEFKICFTLYRGENWGAVVFSKTENAESGWRVEPDAYRH